MAHFASAHIYREHPTPPAQFRVLFGTTRRGWANRVIVSNANSTGADTRKGIRVGRGFDATATWPDFWHLVDRCTPE